MPLPWLSAGDALEIPVEQLAMWVLERLISADARAAGRFPIRSGQILTWVSEWHRAEGGTGDQAAAAKARPALVDAIAEAWEWLRINGLLAPAVGSGLSDDAFIITRAGHEISNYLEPLAMGR